MLRVNNLSVFIFLSLFLTSCASTNFNNIEDAKSFEYVKDEKNLWKAVEDIQSNLLKSDAIYPDEDLHAYINGVLNNLIARDKEKWGTNIEVHIIYDSDFNASMYPNGFMLIHTGLLANIDNEAQLATVLGHELTHFLHRHSLKGQNKKINVNAALSTLRVAAIGASYGLAYSGYDPSAMSTIHDTISLGLVGAFYGYSRSQETDADAYGFELIRQAGYDPEESKKAFENMFKAQELLDRKDKTPYFYHSHPKTKSRIENFERYLNSLSRAQLEGQHAIKGEKEFMNRIKEVLLDNLELDLKKNRLKLAKRQLDKYKDSFTEDCRSLYFEAMLLLRDGKIDEAINKLTKSKSLDSDYSNVLKELGLQLYKKGEKNKAKENFKRYLELQPNAKDAEFIRGYIDG